LDDLKIAQARKALLKAKDMGITLSVLDNGRLRLQGPSSLKGSNMEAELLTHKALIYKLLTNPSPGIANTVERLRKGQQLLLRMQDRMWTEEGAPTGSERNAELYWDSIVRWDLLDMLLRGYGEYDGGCPIGPEGCDPESPVLCRNCGKAQG
jgi:hypothetical protein